MKKKPRYTITTWDMELQAFTPQAGVDEGPYTLFGLRKAILALRGMGYDGNRGDPSVLIERCTGKGCRCHVCEPEPLPSRN